MIALARRLKGYKFNGTIASRDKSMANTFLEYKTSKPSFAICWHVLKIEAWM